MQKIVKRWGWVTEKKRLCDICGKGIYKVCKMCGRDICRAHTVADDRDGCSDYPDRYCTTCWEAGELSRNQMARADERYNRTLDGMQDEWEQAAKAARKGEGR